MINAILSCYDVNCYPFKILPAYVILIECLVSANCLHLFINLSIKVKVKVYLPIKLSVKVKVKRSLCLTD